MGHVLVKVVVGVHLRGCAADIVESPRRCWRRAGELLNVNRLIQVLLMSRTWPAEQVVPLAELLAIVLSGLDLVVVVETFLLF